MNILITGATGFIGRHLVEELAQDKHQLYALVRSTSKTDMLVQRGVNLVYGDITDKASLDKLVGLGLDCIYHCAARVDNREFKALMRINVEGTHNICDLALKVKVKRFIYLSSVAVVSGHKQVPLTEDLDFSYTNDYGLSKVEAEKIVLDLRAKDVPTAIIRPPVVYGEDEPHLLKLVLKLLRWRMLPLIAAGRDKWHMVYVKNLSFVLRQALYNDAFLKESFFVCDEQVLTTKEIFNIFSRSIGAKPPLVLPLWMTPIFTHMPFLGKAFTNFLRDKEYDISRLKALGIRMPYSAPQALFNSGFQAFQNLISL